MAGAADPSPTLQTTPLHALHLERGAKMVPFAGYDMPVQFPLGVLGEHKHTRDKAGLFDVSHMGQVRLDGASHDAVAAALETLVPGEIAKLGQGRMRYSVLLNDQGGILDDLMITRLPGTDGSLFLVVNAACKAEDIRLMQDRLSPDLQVTPMEDRALLALQGPLAAEVLGALLPSVRDLKFMTAMEGEIDGVPVIVTRSGYTGEDGYEISVPAQAAEALARALLSSDAVEPIGLGARDSLRLEAGLCLYGSDLDETTTPIEADLGFVIGKRRREEAGFPGAERILKELRDGVSRKRVGIVPEGKAPARAGTEIVDGLGAVIGRITSGTFGPSLGGPLAMGYVPPSLSETGSDLGLMVRGSVRPARVAAMPFVPHRYYRGS